jgi:hypothetical protein
MPGFDVFLSYATEDRDQAMVFVRALEQQGLSVWWDRTIRPGRSFEEVIEAELSSAKCVVVLWSEISVGKHWVKTEAAEAMERNVLVPAAIANVKLPLQFRRLQAASLTTWKGDTSDPQFQLMLQAIFDHAGPRNGAPAPAEGEPQDERPAAKSTRPSTPAEQAKRRYATDLVREALFVENIKNYPGNKNDPVGTVDYLTSRLSSTVLTSDEQRERLLKEVEAWREQALSAPEESGVTMVEQIVNPILEQLPTRKQYLAALETLSPRLRVQVLEQEYNKARSANRDYMARQSLLFLNDLGERKVCLRLLKERLLVTAEPSRMKLDPTYKLARKILGDEFDGWWSKDIAPALMKKG